MWFVIVVADYLPSFVYYADLEIIGSLLMVPVLPVPCPGVLGFWLLIMIVVGSLMSIVVDVLCAFAHFLVLGSRSVGNSQPVGTPTVFWRTRNFYD
jgi:hypothetical protein